MERSESENSGLSPYYGTEGPLSTLKHALTHLPGWTSAPAGGPHNRSTSILSMKTALMAAAMIFTANLAVSYLLRDDPWGIILFTALAAETRRRGSPSFLA